MLYLSVPRCELARFRPNSPVVLFRGFRLPPSVVNGYFSTDKLESWSINEDVARGFAENSSKGVVLRAIFNPKDILVDTMRLPESIYSHEEEEMIVLPGVYKVGKIPLAAEIRNLNVTEFTRGDGVDDEVVLNASANSRLNWILEHESFMSTQSLQDDFSN